MKWLILFLLFSFNYLQADDISKTNELKKKAEVAYKNKDYVKAAGIYSDLFNKYKIKDDNAGLNYAHSLLLVGETESAVTQYKNLTSSANKQVKSIANQQLGNASAKNNNYKEALDYYKEALKADPENEDARFNAELMKKKLKDNPPQQDDKQNQDKQEQDKQEKQDQQNKQNQDQNKGNGDKEDKNNKDNKGDKGDKDKDDKGKDGKGDKDKKDEEGKDKKDQKGDKGDKKDDKDKEGKDQQSKGDKKDEKGNKEKEAEEGKDGKEPKKEEGKQDPNGNSQGKPLENMQISQEKAKMLLDAMRNAEKQYLQQLKKEPTKRKDKGKPDW